MARTGSVLVIDDEEGDARDPRGAADARGLSRDVAVERRGRAGARALRVRSTPRSWT
jgi:hypothetical protein